MSVLVTGGAGFIGSNFVRHLLDATNRSVITLDALTYAGSMRHLDAVLDHPRHDFVDGDIRDQSLVAELFEEVDSVVNFAAESHVDRSIDSAEPFVATNVQGTRTLLDAARDADIDRFVQISTDEVYGEIRDGKFTETDPLDPRNPYAATKAGADLLALSYHSTYDLPVLVTRSSNNFGPHQHSEKLIPKLIDRAAREESLPIYGDGSNIREWTYVQDNCRAIRTVLDEGTTGEIYNVGSGDERTNLDVARTVLDAVGAPETLIEFVEDRPGHDERYALDASKMATLGWEPEWSFEEGLERTVEQTVGRN
ncbi:dTDP-glucose 4,6-dehydratase [Halococcus morrhuae DSM 1307]|uniref:dTDP-glucose 4,6-dehydratase n=1 Tax=Halococcus morrhuae DSM 1307 TaxID=931277 RepID=M0MGQ2_HALMO|nr:dTDP-glucose 4,6-dehydratase [Halococcus morrhuae]EMA44508.1 dTDP-glucose 4,6-dehydratase [Halococcus morrhuae DSM 1307]